MGIKEIAQENFKRWNEALLTKDPKKVAELYAKNNTFLPTLSPDFKKGNDEAEEYFIHFLEKNPKGEIKEEAIQLMGENFYLHSGMYDFEVGDEGAKSIVEARFSFVWEKENNGEWKIIHHHSSIKPQK